MKASVGFAPQFPLSLSDALEIEGVYEIENSQTILVSFGNNNGVTLSGGIPPAYGYSGAIRGVNRLKYGNRNYRRSESHSEATVSVSN